MRQKLNDFLSKPFYICSEVIFIKVRVGLIIICKIPIWIRFWVQWDEPDSTPDEEDDFF